MPTKLTAPVVYSGHGFKIFVDTPSKPKKGKSRIWICIRQDDTKPKEWRVYETLSYAKGVDVQFVKD